MCVNVTSEIIKCIIPGRTVREVTPGSQKICLVASNELRKPCMLFRERIHNEIDPTLLLFWSSVDGSGLCLILVSESWFFVRTLSSTWLPFCVTWHNILN